MFPYVDGPEEAENGLEIRPKGRTWSYPSKVALSWATCLNHSAKEQWGLFLQCSHYLRLAGKSSLSVSVRPESM